MSEETKKTPQAEEPAVEPNTAEQAAPETAPEQAAAPETNAEAADPKKKDGFFNKKARELEAVKAKLDAAEKNANQAKDQLLRMAAISSVSRMGMIWFTAKDTPSLNFWSASRVERLR